MKLKQSAKKWLDEFMRLHYLKTREDAVYKLIEIYKAWNENILKSNKHKQFVEETGQLLRFNTWKLDKKPIIIKYTDMDKLRKLKIGDFNG